MKIKTSGRLEQTIPTGSMADIVFLLIIFFMLTSTLVKESGIELTLPQAKKTEQKKMQRRSITVSKSGKLYYNGVPLGAAAVEEQLAESLDGVEGIENRGVSIKGDKETDYQHIVTAIDIVNRLDGNLILILEEEAVPETGNRNIAVGE